MSFREAAHVADAMLTAFRDRGVETAALEAVAGLLTRLRQAEAAEARGREVEAQDPPTEDASTADLADPEAPRARAADHVFGRDAARELSALASVLEAAGARRAASRAARTLETYFRAHPSQHFDALTEDAPSFRDSLARSAEVERAETAEKEAESAKNVAEYISRFRRTEARAEKLNAVVADMKGLGLRLRSADWTAIAKELTGHTTRTKAEAEHALRAWILLVARYDDASISPAAAIRQHSA